MPLRSSTWLSPFGISLLALSLISCEAAQTVDVAQTEEAPTSKQGEVIYRAFFDPVIWVIRDSEMYSGFLPVDYSSDEFQESFVPISRSAAEISGAECIFPASPMDEYGGTIAFGRPPNSDFEGSFVCGKFRFDVVSCSQFELTCEAKYIRVFSIPNNRYVNYQIWDNCRGIYLISNIDLSANPENWKHAGYSTGKKGLFASQLDDC